MIKPIDGNALDALLWEALHNHLYREHIAQSFTNHIEDELSSLSPSSALEGDEWWRSLMDKWTKRVNESNS